MVSVMPRRDPKQIWTGSQGGAKLAVVEAVVRLVMAGTLVALAAAYSAPVVIAEAYAAMAVLIVARPCRWLLLLATARRNGRRAERSEALAELRRELAALPETSHPLGL
jgi:hypothetical protein